MRAILDHPDTALLAAAAALLAAVFACGLLAQPLFGLSLAAVVVAGLAFLALRFPIPFCVVWLLVTGMSLEMALSDIAGQATYQPAIVMIKGIGIGLGVLCVLRFGPGWTRFARPGRSWRWPGTRPLPRSEHRGQLEIGSWVDHTVRVLLFEGSAILGRGSHPCRQVVPGRRRGCLPATRRR
jgi:hypothetical protein